MTPHNTPVVGTVRIPEIVPIVLREAAKLRSESLISQSIFDQQLARLEEEELVPRGLELLVRDLPDGTIRYLIRNARTSRVQEMIDCRTRKTEALPAPVSLAA